MHECTVILKKNSGVKMGIWENFHCMKTTIDQCYCEHSQNDFAADCFWYSRKTIMSSSEAKQTEERWTENGCCSQTMDLFFLQRILYTLYLL